MRVQKAERCDTQAEPRFPPGAIGAKASKKWRACGLKMAERTGLEPATPGVTGRYSNQLNYRSKLYGVELTNPYRRITHPPCKYGLQTDV